MFQSVTEHWKLISAINFIMTWLAHNKVKCGLFSRIIRSYNSSVQNCQKLSEFVYELSNNWMVPNWMVPQNVPFAASRDYAENVNPHLWLHGNMSLYRGCVCYFWCRMFNPTNLLKLSRSVKGFSVCGGPKMAVSHWLELSPLQQVSTTVLPVMMQIWAIQY